MAENKLLSKLTKTEILTLPGFNDDAHSKKLKSVLQRELWDFVVDHNAYKIGLKVKDYKELFSKIPAPPKELKPLTRYVDSEEYKARQQQRKDAERNNKIINEEMLALDVGDFAYDYKERVKHVADHKRFQQRLQKWLELVQKRESFEVTVGDNDDKKLAFCEVLRYVYNHKRSNKDVILVKATTLDDKIKYFTLNKPDAKHNNVKSIDILIGHISGEIDLQTDCSDMNPYVANAFIPVKYELMFVNAETIKNHKKRKHNGKKYTIAKHNDDSDIEVIDLEDDDDFRELIEGSFFRYVNTTDFDLTRYQIYNKIEAKNYKDNCFIYACSQANVFTPEEMNSLRSMVLTRSVPNNKILQIAKDFKCHFVVKSIDEHKDVKRQMRINVDTRRKSWAQGFKRSVELLLYKEHYMINDDDVGFTTYYMSNKVELENKNVSNAKLIYGLRSDGTARYAAKGAKLITLLRYMFDNNMFKEINACEQNILATCEYENHLRDYIDLNYDEKQCCRLIRKELKKAKVYTKIYYSDFEADSTITPHKEYLNCTMYLEDKQLKCKTFEGDNIGERLLEFLEDGSLTYFHNLKYDACFFKNVEGWETPKIIERNGTVLRITMRQKANNAAKTLIFADSLSLIPAPLRDFGNMFNLKVHKEIFAYKLFTADNRNKRILDVSEFINAYDEEQRKYHVTNAAKLNNDHKQLIENAKIANAYDEVNNKIDIMKYAIFYCKKDCEVLMKGVMKFNKDLANVFKTTNCTLLPVWNYISISAVGYQFCKQYGCFDECYELSGKPQDFIGRCVSGGRTMTANNKKQFINAKIQDFDAVSLYPSAMKFMSGVPRGKPKIIPQNVTTQELLSYDTFFAEINITSLKCKCDNDYAFGLIFKHNDAGSKIYCNESVEHFYLDKRYFQDLMTYYDFEYEFVRGYYFDEGFNTKINEFIEILFNLRLQYKQEKNPLQNTIKLLLNSIYGKSILKPIKYETTCVTKDKMFNYIYRNYNYIKEVNECEGCKYVYVKRIKAINKHFNLPQFGVSVLSWSKWLMNRVMCTAEQNNIALYYQDTDSMHLREEDVSKLAHIFHEKYGCELIGSKLGQFHCDFDAFEGAEGEIHSRKLIALGKKSYLDILVDEQGNEGFHIRMKGVPRQCVLNKCKALNISVEELYERMYNGATITFDILDGSNAFRKDKFFQMTNIPKFERKLKF